jgi:hypothetical protein
VGSRAGLKTVRARAQGRGLRMPKGHPNRELSEAQRNLRLRAARAVQGGWAEGSRGLKVPLKGVTILLSKFPLVMLSYQKIET